MPSSASATTMKKNLPTPTPRNWDPGGAPESRSTDPSVLVGALDVLFWEVEREAREEFARVESEQVNEAQADVRRQRDEEEARQHRKVPPYSRVVFLSALRESYV